MALSLVLGAVLGGISGYFGGAIDTVIQRVIEILRSIPTIPLWMGLAAALPRDWSILQVYFAITVIISLLAWTELARVVRGRFLSLREEDFVTAALAQITPGGELTIVNCGHHPPLLNHRGALRPPALDRRRHAAAHSALCQRLLCRNRHPGRVGAD